MFHNNFNNMMSDRGNQESKANIEIMLRSLPERANWFEPAYVEPFEDDAIYQQHPTYFQQRQENFQPFENSNEVDYGWQHEYDQYEPFNPNFSYQQEPIYSNQQQEYFQPFEGSYEEIDYRGNYEYQYEPLDPNFSYNDPSDVDHQGNEVFDDLKSMLQQVIECQKRCHESIIGKLEGFHNKVDGIFEEQNVGVEGLASHMNTLSNLVAQSSNEDETGDEACDFSPNVDNVLLEGETYDDSPTNYDVVVAPQRELIYTQQQDIREEEIEEIIHTIEVALIEDALKEFKTSKVNKKVEEEEVHHEGIFEEGVDHFTHLLEEVLIEDALMHYLASTIDEKKEEEEVIQIFELPEKELNEDDGFYQGVSRSPIPRSKHSQGLRERLEWKIKHRRKMKPLNV